MNLRRVAVLMLAVACASEGSDYGLATDPEGIPVTAGFGGSSGSEPGPFLDIDDGPVVGSIRGSWALVSARALEMGDGFVLRLYPESLPDDGSFVPTQNYVRLTVPAPGDFTILPAGQGADDVLAEFIICKEPGSDCIADAASVELATGRIVIERSSTGSLAGGVTLRSGMDAVNGSFTGVAPYAAVCSARACRCNGSQLEQCSWDRGSWLEASCMDSASCSEMDSSGACCGTGSGP